METEVRASLPTDMNGTAHLVTPAGGNTSIMKAPPHAFIDPDSDQEIDEEEKACWKLKGTSVPSLQLTRMDSVQKITSRTFTEEELCMFSHSRIVQGWRSAANDIHPDFLETLLQMYGYYYLNICVNSHLSLA